MKIRLLGLRDRRRRRRLLPPSPTRGPPRHALNACVNAFAEDALRPRTPCSRVQGGLCKRAVRQARSRTIISLRYTFDLQADDPKTGTVVARVRCSPTRRGSVALALRCLDSTQAAGAASRLTSAVRRRSMSASRAHERIMRTQLVVAVAENDVIGRRNQLPWHLSADLRHFKALTLGKPVLMGRKTYESIGKALPGPDQYRAEPRRRIRARRIARSCTSARRPRGRGMRGRRVPLDGDRRRRDLSAMPAARERIHLTLVHARIEDGDTFFDGWRGRNGGSRRASATRRTTRTPPPTASSRSSDRQSAAADGRSELDLAFRALEIDVRERSAPGGEFGQQLCLNAAALLRRPIRNLVVEHHHRVARNEALRESAVRAPGPAPAAAGNCGSATRSRISR